MEKIYDERGSEIAIRTNSEFYFKATVSTKLTTLVSMNSLTVPRGYVTTIRVKSESGKTETSTNSRSSRAHLSIHHDGLQVDNVSKRDTREEVIQ